MHMRVEKISPFQCLPKQEWRHVYVVLSGTHLCIHKVKTISLAGHSMPTAGKLIKRYTLQHAEVGLASDVEHNVLMPASRLAHFIPNAARRKAFERDPDLFKPIPQTIMRLRLEIDQILLAHSFEDRIFGWIGSLSAGIDIALPLDERAAPKACTIPRRRRRQQRSSQIVENITDRRIIEEQEQIMREMYPSLAQTTTEDPSGQTELSRTETTNDSNVLSLTTTNDQEDDIDFAMLAEETIPSQDSGSRPSNSRQTTASTMSTYNSISPSSADFDIRGKWAPPHGHSQAQQFRYIRRCMPVLLYDTPRASSIIMCHGRRLRINNRMDMLEEWELAPPTYDAHSFPEGLDRMVTLASSLATTSSTVSGDSIGSIGSRNGSVGKADAPTLERSKTRAADVDQKRVSRYEIPNASHKMPERTLLEEENCRCWVLREEDYGHHARRECLL